MAYPGHCWTVAVVAVILALLYCVFMLGKIAGKREKCAVLPPGTTVTMNNMSPEQMAQTLAHIHTLRQ